MSPRKIRQIFFISFRLGRVSDYDPTIFPLVRKKTALMASEVYLEYTLDELIKIREMAKVQPNYRTTYDNLKRQYIELLENQTKIEERKGTLNPFKTFAHYRKNRLFIEASYIVSRRAKITSEIIRRDLVLTSQYSMALSDDVVAVDRGDSIAEKEEIVGLAVACDRPIDDNLRGIIDETIGFFRQPDLFDDPGPVVNDTVDRAPADNVGTSTSSPRVSCSNAGNTYITYVENLNYNKTSSSVSDITIHSPTLQNFSVNVGGQDNVGSVTQNIGSPTSPASS
ncbi:hypothetical protein V8B97DRAFT_1946364 [Scleroderma yunnanense]